MTTAQRKRFVTILHITLLGTSTLTGLAGNCGLAAAGIAMYLTIQHIEGGN